MLNIRNFLKLISFVIISTTGSFFFIHRSASIGKMAEPLRSIKKNYVHKVLNNMAADLQIYPVLPTEFIYQDTDLSKRNIVKIPSLRAAQGEITAVSFAIAAGETPLNNLDIEIEDLKKDGIPVSSPGIIDPYIIKIWRQASIHWEVFNERKDAILVPELILKDDRINLTGNIDAKGRYQAPHILNVPFGTNIPAHTLKQVWLKIVIPESMPSGKYTQRLIITANEDMISRQLDLLIEILPFCLPVSSRLYGIYYRRSPWLVDDFYRPEFLFLEDLKEIKAAGFNSITCYDEDHLDKWIQAMKKVEMSGPVVILGVAGKNKIEKAIDTCKIHDMSCYFYGVDEPYSTEKRAKHRAVSAGMHKNGGMVMTAILPEVAIELKNTGEGLDWANLTYHESSQSYFKTKKRNNNLRIAPFETYYWQVYQENPTRNRFLCGYYLWKTAADGVFPFEYQNPGMFPYKRDIIQKKFHSTQKNNLKTYRHWRLTYPSQDGPVSTLQWEGCRFGINDVRYLAYLDELLNRLSMQDKSEAVFMRLKLDRLVSGMSIPPKKISVKINPYIEPIRFEKAREEVVELILSVIKKLDSRKKDDDIVSPFFYH